jgi:hypothetical protein
LKTLEPAALELSLGASEHLEKEREELDGLWHKRLERADLSLRLPSAFGS